MLYFSIITIAMLIISVVNIVAKTAVWYYVVIAVVWCTALQFVLDGVVALIINSLPDRWFGINNPLFSVSKAETKLYRRIKVKRWKDKVWELGGLGGFSKKHLKEPDNPRHIEKFIIECNRGTVVHRLSYPVGFLVMLTLRGVCSFTIALPVAMVNLYLNVLPTIVLRYNIPKLKVLLERIKRKEDISLKTVK